jgi:prepilin-type processing-associated H-X9-DG protein/prepilin-type N-terminal cleavage/methylation domain-containing protein
MRRPAAFTLIELLVVISIIAVLIGILLPALSMARIRAQQTVSASNMRSIGLALHMYQDEFDDWFPRTTHSLDFSQMNRAWIFALAPYLTDARPVDNPVNPGETLWSIGPVRICPRDPKGAERLAGHGTSYIMDEHVTVEFRDADGFIVPSESFNRRMMIPRPSQTITTYVGADHLSVNVTADHTHSRGWFNWFNVVADIAPARYGRGSTFPHTNGSSNYLYADGHVAERSAADKKALIDAGVNFARPPQ